MHEVLVNRLGGLSLPRKSVVRLTDRPDMTLDVYHGRKTIMQCNALNQQTEERPVYIQNPRPHTQGNNQAKYLGVPIYCSVSESKMRKLISRHGENSSHTHSRIP